MLPKKTRILLWSAATILFIVGLGLIVVASAATDSFDETQQIAESLGAEAVGENSFREKARTSSLVGIVLTVIGMGLYAPAAYLTWFGDRSPGDEGILNLRQD